MNTNTQASHDLPAKVSIQRTAKYFDVDERTVRRWIANGRLTATRIGPRLIRVDRDSISRLARPVGGIR
ncbi:helix-turn-helix domain-containing protein [Mycobacterium stomatepiae]|uniref:helix-turn-helix domain-containing protein n=1 Tax=Mycobacterium stomatepiae TaxID=470076 RepID=UPI0021F2F11B|nr:helix-turn-helix domain-containing protein [Mycobacterium stomatepiae]